MLLHGVGLSHLSYLPLAAHLGRHGRVVTFDLPGFGSTPAPRRRLSVEEYARLIAIVLQRLDVVSYVAVGHSMGSQFALELALQHPEQVTGVVMIGPVTDPARRSAVRQGLALARDSLREPLSTNALVFGDYLRCGPRWYTTEITAMLAYPTHERALGLTRPLLVLRGADDPIADDAWCTLLAASVAEGCLVSIPRNRHVVIHTAPHAVGEAIVRFVLNAG